jgi:hypothetical protein
MAKYRYKEMSEATNHNLLKGSGYRWKQSMTKKRVVGRHTEGYE